jgi:hypothetical protein
LYLETPAIALMLVQRTDGQRLRGDDSSAHSGVELKLAAGKTLDYNGTGSRPE